MKDNRSAIHGWRVRLLLGAALTVAIGGLAVPLPVAHAEPVNENLTGRIVLPDGSPAVGARIDLIQLNPDGTKASDLPFAGGGTDPAGLFSIPLPESAQLVQAALQNDHELPYVAEVVDLATGARTTVFTSSRRLTARLVDADDEEPPSLPVPDVSVTPPPASDEEFDAGETVAWVLDQASGLSAARINADPDMALAQDDLNDADLIPAPGMLVDVLPVPPSIEDVMANPTSDSQDGSEQNGCRLVNTAYLPAKGQGQPVPNFKVSVRLGMFQCSEDDPNAEYYIYDWDGWAAPANTDWLLWRLKFRSEAKAYYMYDQDPKSNKSADGDTGRLSWQVGVEKVATGSIGGTFDFHKKKIHPWYDENRDLYHVSWISHTKYGSPYGDDRKYMNGGGVTFQTPRGDNGYGVSQSVWIYRCRSIESANNNGTPEELCDDQS